MTQTYGLAREGVFRTVQGEGALMGLPMVFIRLAGCSIGCPGCDTDYAPAGRITPEEVRRQVQSLAYGGVEWAWVTGGEPTDYNLCPLFVELRRLGLRVALATAGTRPVSMGWAQDGADFLSVSPHDRSKWAQRSGDQLNVVPGLNGLSLDEWRDDLLEAARHFSHRYVTPLYGDAASLAECMQWANCYRGWKVGIQSHRIWGVA